MLLTRTNCLLVLAMSLSGCSGLIDKKPSKRVLEAIELIRDGKTKELDDYILKEDVPGAGFFYGMMSAAFGEKRPISHIEVESEKVDGGSASVTVRWHYKDGGSAFERFRLKREDGTWRIDL